MMLCVYRAEGKESSKELKDKKKKFFLYVGISKSCPGLDHGVIMTEFNLTIFLEGSFESQYESLTVKVKLKLNINIKL